MLTNHKYIIVSEVILVLKECFVESENKREGGGEPYINYRNRHRGIITVW